MWRNGGHMRWLYSPRARAPGRGPARQDAERRARIHGEASSMKKSVAVTSGVIIVLAGAWLGGTWYTGKRIEARAQESLLRANEELKAVAPQLALRIELVKYERGFFSSDAQYVVRSDMPSLGKDIPEGLRFDAHIQHGPFTQGGIARGQLLPHLAFVHAEVGQTEVLKKVFELTKGATPLWTDTVVSYGGKAHVKGGVPAVEYSDEQGTLKFTGAEFNGEFDRKTFAGSGHLSSKGMTLAMKEEGKPFDVNIADISVDAQSQRGKFGISLGKSSMQIKRIGVNAPQEKLNVTVDDLTYGVSIGETDAKLQGDATYRVAKVKVGEYDFGGGELTVKVDNIDGQAAQRLNDMYTKAIRDLSTGDSESSDSYDALLVQAMGAVSTVLAGNPTIKVEPLSWKTDKGESRFTLALTLGKPDSFDGDRAEILRQLVKNLDARLTLHKPMVSDLAAKVLQIQGSDAEQAKKETEEQMAMLTGMAEMMNFAKNDGDALTTTFTYADGKALLNGKEVPVDDLINEMVGGMNPDDMDAGDDPFGADDMDMDTPTADSDTVRSFDPDFVASLIEQSGYTYEQQDGELGPVFIVKGDLAAQEVRIDLNCDFDEGCLEMAWTATFKQKQAASLKAINTWNREHRWSRAYGEDNGAAVLQMDVVAEGGIGKTNARYQFDAFLDMIEEFPKVVYGTPAPR
ncbi:hypothetical protein CEG14_22930 [Bordetella genomosp. 1]|uniref:DUF945 domain-containing protein n=2 Tax=Bordetella genomosp. 1 TaxID=1395607 RepID=A0A261RUP6_9BORD|nr:hypothetical protein CEG14_22930 [Bordetella genomosp. 1]